MHMSTGRGRSRRVGNSGWARAGAVVALGAAASVGLGQAVVLHDEATDADLPGFGLNALDLGTINAGTWLVSASQRGVDRDYFTVRVPAGHELVDLRVTSYVGNDPTAFIGMQAGTQFTEPPNGADTGEILGYTHYGPGRGNVNQNLLPAMGNAFGAQGFAPPLGPGDYVFWLNQTGQLSTATFRFTIEGCPVDLNADGVVDNGDIISFVELFLAGDLAVDFNSDAILDNGDINAFVLAFLAGCA